MNPSVLIITAAVALTSCGKIQQEPLSTGAKDDPQAEPTVTEPGDVMVKVSPRQLSPKPGEFGEVRIEVTPPGVHEVEIALLGDTQNAYVEQSRVMTDEDGQASVRVNVPADTGGFRLRATSGGSFDEARVDVVQITAGTVRVELAYTGLRSIDRWAVGLETDTPCAEVDFLTGYRDPVEATATYPDAGLPVYDPISVVGVPANENVTLYVRGNEYVYGCREGIQLKADQVQIERIAVTDRPLQLSAIDFQFQLHWELTPEISEVFDTAITQMVGAFTAGFEQDAQVLIERMARIADDEVTFRAGAEAGSWSEALALNLQEPGATRGLRSRVLDWLSRARTRLFTNNPLLEGRLVGLPKGGIGLLTPSALAGMPPEPLAFRNTRVSFHPEGFDVLGLETTVVWSLPLALSALANHIAWESTSEQSAVGDDGIPDAEVAAEPGGAVAALSAALDCTRVATVLSDASGQGYPGCDSNCLAQYCEDALVAMWHDVTTAIPGTTKMYISASGPTTIRDDALPLAVSGAWAGSVEVFGKGSGVQSRGQFEAVRPTESP